jgi:hypothetical protein
MNTDLPIASILSSLQTQIAQHREQEAIHAEREAFHRERRAEHAAELEQLVRGFESLKASVENAARLATRIPLPPSPPPPEDLPVGRKLSTSYLATRVIEGKAPDEPFGPKEVAAEINRRFAARLGRTVDVRQVSVALRWMADTGRIARAEKGHQRRQSKYTRQA